MEILTDVFNLSFLKEKLNRKELIIVEDSDYNFENSFELIQLRVPSNHLLIDTRDESEWKVYSKFPLNAAFMFLDGDLELNLGLIQITEIESGIVSRMHRKFSRKVEDYNIPSIMVRTDTTEQEFEMILNGWR